jgi:glycosyltransferase involved in cell wall biosynthesis
MESIFISIASYRDHELEKTIQDCLRKAVHRERLFFGIHWQHDNHDFLEQTFDRRFKFIDTYYKESKGTCWARHEAQKLYAGEDYVLQIDSHMRFAYGWDVICVDGIKWLQQKGNRKVIISSIVPGYDPKDDSVLRDIVLTHRLGDFNKDGIISLKSAQAPDTPEPFSPGQSIAAGFLFSIGDLYREVLIDPDLYFWGEEITYAVRAYTYGYDMYYCHRPIIHHYYMRSGHRRHWGDHQGWHERDQSAKARVRSLLMESGEVPDLGLYGLGTVRTLADYEEYAGVDFKNRTVRGRETMTDSGTSTTETEVPTRAPAVTERITVSELPAVSCVCLTFGRPHLLAESIHSFIKQDYPGKKELVVLNDLDRQILHFDHPEVRIINVPMRFHTVGEKRNACVAMASHDLLFVWDDDDIYLPHRLSLSVSMFDSSKRYFKPSTAFMLNNGVLTGPERNLFHGGCCWSRNLFDEVRGYAHLDSAEDLEIELLFDKIIGPGKNAEIRPEEIFYVYRWGGTNSFHLSGFSKGKSGGKTSYEKAGEWVEENIRTGGIQCGEIRIEPHWKADYPKIVADHLAAQVISAA